ncbi:MAG: F0F1 ATP synthase subunit delta [Candidatus Kerfeldbacteria bacterium]|nr:F0F1 ATP synthase subunit delta [Candidatus Kerfeldbacteria bacterium]
MSYAPRQYARAFLAAARGASAGEQEKIAERLSFLLRRHRSIRMLPSIVAEARRLQDEATGTIRVAVTTAREVPVGRLQKDLVAFLQAPVSLDHDVDPSLLGGAVVRIGDTEIDGSVRMMLVNLSDHLRATQP